MEKLSTFSDIANVVIALVSVLLAFYIFIHQREKDNKSSLETQNQIEQNFRLQWFKELIVQPNQDNIENFYQLLFAQIPRIEQASDDDKHNIDEEIKAAFYDLRRKFVSLLSLVSSKVHADVETNLEDLIDEITNGIFNEREKSDIPFSKNLEIKIVESQKKLLSEIYNFRGIVPSHVGVSPKV